MQSVQCSHHVHVIYFHSVTVCVTAFPFVSFQLARTPEAHLRTPYFTFRVSTFNARPRMPFYYTIISMFLPRLRLFHVDSWTLRYLCNHTCRILSYNTLSHLRLAAARPKPLALLTSLKMLHYAFSASRYLTLFYNVPSRYAPFVCW